MRELNTTVQQNQANQEDTIGTWVGFPHNMLVPRYFRYIHYYINKQQQGEILYSHWGSANFACGCYVHYKLLD